MALVPGGTGGGGGVHGDDVVERFGARMIREHADQQWRLMGYNESGKLRVDARAIAPGTVLRLRFACCDNVNSIKVPKASILAVVTKHLDSCDAGSRILHRPDTASARAEVGCGERPSASSADAAPLAAAEAGQPSAGVSSDEFRLEHVLPTAEHQRAAGSLLQAYGATECVAHPRTA